MPIPFESGAPAIPQRARSVSSLRSCRAFDFACVRAGRAATYKTKCAGCHGQGKVGRALKATSLTAGQIPDLLTKGDDAKKPPHQKALSGVSADDAKAAADFVKTLQQASAFDIRMLRE